MNHASLSPSHVRVAIVGTGFAGLGAAIALEREGVDYAILERAHDVGGTWRDNTYPGCRCDVPSHLYSFSFAPNPNWSETYSPQPEIFRYLRDTAERFGVVDKVRFGHDVREAAWQQDEQHWRLTTPAGTVTADVVILGNGPLSEPSVPDIPGIDSFQGTMFHSARWDHAYDFKGKRVAAIGTGASAIQFVPEIQPDVEHLTVFQRTPPWVLPHGNRRISPLERAMYRRFPALQRIPRAFVYWSRELFVTGLLRNSKGLARLEALAKRHLLRQVTDRELRAKVIPDYRPGCKRLLLSNDWYPAIQQPNVSVVTEKIVAIGPNSVQTADGVEHEVNCIILGTGFRVTDNPVLNRVLGDDGRSLTDHWKSTGIRAYLGSTVPSFPNLFIMAGPNTGIGHTSLVVMMEAQLNYVVSALKYMDSTGAASVELRRPVMDDYTNWVQRKASATVWNSGGCASWYLDAEGRNTTLWPDYTFKFKQRTKRFDPAKYEVVARRVAAEKVSA